MPRIEGEKYNFLHGMRPFVLACLGLAFLLAGAATALGVPQRLANAPGTSASPDFACTVKAAPCDAGEVEVLRMSSLSNAHAGLSAASAYGHTICCTGLANLGTECAGTHATVLTLSGTDNAHVASDGSYGNEACLSLEGEGIVDCAAGAVCDEGYVCLATISDTTNAHVADCGAEAYDTKVCCQALPDNCPEENPDQSNLDKQDGGDICDPCPNDDTDTCNQDRSAGETIGPAGGEIITPDQSVKVTVPEYALQQDTSISMTGDAGGSFELKANRGRAIAVFLVDIQPSGQGFAHPVTIVFAWDDADNDGRVDGTWIRERNLYIVKDGEVLFGPCRDVPLQCDQDLNTFTFTVSSFSEVVLAAPQDTDDDEVPDKWDIERDNCPEVKNGPNEEGIPGVGNQTDTDGEGLGDACEPELCLEDTDCDDDQFSDFEESYVGTDIQDACPDSSSHDAWPPDITMSTTVDVTDALLFLAAFPSAEGMPNYSKRLDMAAGDGVVDVTDALKFLPRFPSACPP